MGKEREKREGMREHKDKRELGEEKRTGGRQSE